MDSRSIEANGFHNVNLIEAAASERAGIASLYLGRKSGWHSLYAGPVTTAKTIEIRTVALDDFGLDSVDLIKIDVEGAEERVLNGAADLISRCRPAVVLDLHPHFGADIHAVEQFFQVRGYSAYALKAPDVRLAGCRACLWTWPFGLLEATSEENREFGAALSATAETLTAGSFTFPAVLGR